MKEMKIYQFAVLAVILWPAVILLIAESEDLTVLLLTKVAAAVLFLIARACVRHWKI